MLHDILLVRMEERKRILRNPYRYKSFADAVLTQTFITDALEVTINTRKEKLPPPKQRSRLRPYISDPIARIQ